MRHPIAGRVEATNMGDVTAFCVQCAILATVYALATYIGWLF